VEVGVEVGGSGGVADGIGDDEDDGVDERCLNTGSQSLPQTCPWTTNLPLT
jgi:hypothetical protein